MNWIIVIVFGIIGICSFNGEDGLDIGEMLVAYLEIEWCDVYRNGYI